MIRPIPPAPPRHLAFPGETTDGSGPSSDPAPSVSHIARRRVSSVPAHEVELEDLEIFDESPESQEPQESPREPEEESRLILRTTRPPVSSREPSSVAPTAMDRELPPESAAVARKRKRPLLVAAAAIALLVVGVGIGARVRTGATEASVRPSALADTGRAAAVAAAPTPSPAPTPSTPPAVPVVAVSSLPRSDGTVVGAEGHRLWIDGHLAESFTAVVACGRHVVQVGSAGTPRDVDIPCGESITVSP